MSRTFAALAAALALLGGFTFATYEVDNHSYTISITRTDSRFSSPQKNALFEIDYPFTTTFTVQNNSGVDIDFVMDGGPNGRKCRVDFDPPEGTKCETAKIRIRNTASATFTAKAKDLDKFDYSWFKVPILGAIPRFASDLKAAEADGNPTKIDPDLELEREYDRALILELLASLFAALIAWFTRRRS